MDWLLILIPAFFAALVQGITGFGSVIIMMIFFPAILPIAEAAGLGGLVMLSCTASLAWRYRRDFHFKQVIGPFLIYAAVATWSVRLGKVLDTHVLRLLLGVLLVALALYFILAKTAGDRRYPWYIAVAFMIISGFFNGLFGIGGPLMALYFLSLSTSVPTYMGNLQGFFLLDTIYITSVRVASGIITVSLIPYILGGIIAATLGTLLATRLAAKWDLAQIKPLIYGFIGLSGLYYLFF
ncbi:MULTISPECIES: sulfite exporter TauE/SafE family protein [unclassified Lacticaseibacillus]|uniref:sulfite exporter TauE/SafE family protein n=1 Tax=unclassified Lacticaseibacillus TaxID=2759744 RepID=UPI001944F304|nr:MULTISPECIES: sulfite exporter TauE/SafE family protein [unclassified Lacticaseibacillus]